jgi:hypothetical protein
MTRSPSSNAEYIDDLDLELLRHERAHQERNKRRNHDHPIHERPRTLRKPPTATACCRLDRPSICGAGHPGVLSSDHTPVRR